MQAPALDSTTQAATKHKQPTPITMVAYAAARSAAAVVLLCLLTMAPVSVSALACSQVVPYIAPCIGFVRGGALTPNCCNGVRGLNSLARSTVDRQSACSCLKSAASALGSVNRAAIASLPSRCGVRLSFAVSADVDCSKIR